MTVSEVNRSLVKDHCGISGNDSDDLLDVYMEAALAKIEEFTGLSSDEIDELPDLTFAYLVIINEMYTNRTVTVDNDKINPTADQIMRMHCRNLIV